MQNLEREINKLKSEREKVIKISSGLRGELNHLKNKELRDMLESPSKFKEKENSFQKKRIQDLEAHVQELRGALSKWSELEKKSQDLQLHPTQPTQPTQPSQPSGAYPAAFPTDSSFRTISPQLQQHSSPFHQPLSKLHNPNTNPKHDSLQGHHHLLSAVSEHPYVSVYGDSVVNNREGPGGLGVKSAYRGDPRGFYYGEGGIGGGHDGIEGIGGIGGIGGEENEEERMRYPNNEISSLHERINSIKGRLIMQGVNIPISNQPPPSALPKANTQRQTQSQVQAAAQIQKDLKNKYNLNKPRNYNIKF
jgi:hypothetical protein